MGTTDRIFWAAAVLASAQGTALAEPPKDSAKQINSCTSAEVVDEILATSANEYAIRCLNLKGLQDYKADSIALDLSIVANGDAQQLQLVPQYTIRRFNNKPTSRSSYVRIRGGLRSAASDNDKSAELFDLDRGRLADGIGGVFGVEYGWSRRDPDEFKAKLTGAIAEVRRDCALAHLVQVSEGVEHPANPVAAATAYCGEPANFSKWMEDGSRANRYFQAILAPLWGYDVQPDWWAGTELALARPTFEYAPLADLSASPTLFDNPLERHEWTYHAQGYVGKTLRSWVAIDDKGQFTRRTFTVAVVGTIAYRREAGFAPRTRDQQVCPPSGTGFVACKKFNIAAPYINEGVTFSARVNVDMARAWILPETGLGLKVSHATDTGQWAGEVPVHLFVDADRNLSGGVRLGISGDGRTGSGVELPGEQRLMLFVGSKFQLGQR